MGRHSARQQRCKFKPHEIHSCTLTKRQNLLRKEGGAELDKTARAGAVLQHRGAWATVWPLWKSASPPAVAHVFLLCDWLLEARSSSTEGCAQTQGHLQKNVSLQTLDNQNVRLGQDGPITRGAICREVTQMDPASCKIVVEIHKHAPDMKERTLRDGTGVSSSKVDSSPKALPCHLFLPHSWEAGRCTS